MRPQLKILTSVILLTTLISALPSGDPYKVESGYLEFEATQKLKYFYTLTKQSKPLTPSKTLIVWINGGPGCSSLSGYLIGIGPYKWKSDQEAILEDNQYTLAAIGDLLTVDQPVGTGMSFSYLDNGKTNSKFQVDYGTVAEDLATFVVEFLEKSTKYYEEIIFVGESMSGHFVPETLLLTKSKLRSVKMEVEMKLVLSSPWIKPSSQYKSFLDYALKMDLITQARAKELTALQNECLRTVQDPKTMQNVKKTCFDFTNKIIQNRFASYDITIKGTGNTYVSAFSWLKGDRFIKQNDLNRFINYEGSMLNFKRINNHVRDNLLVASTLDRQDKLEQVLENGIEVVVLTGKLDFVSNYIGAQDWISGLRYAEGKEKTREKMDYGDIEYECYGSICHFVVDGAGHMVNLKQTERFYRIVKEFVEGNLDGKINF